jgi:hypothetical protein
MKKTMLSILTSTLLLGSYAQAADYSRNVASGNWSTITEWNVGGVNATQLPGTSDRAVLNNDRQVFLDTNASIDRLQVVNSPTSGIVNINNNHTLTVARTIDVANATQTGVGTVNQSAGSVSAGGIITINNAGTYNLTGGTLTMGNAGGTLMTVNGNGRLVIDGGTVSTDLTGKSISSLTGTGTIQMSSGNYDIFGENTTSILIGVEHFEISGGSFAATNQVRLGSNATFQITGSNATINAQAWNQGSNLPDSQKDGTLKFVFDADGISAINLSNFASLDAANIVVDGSAYVGQAGTFDLITSSNLATIAGSERITISGFANGAFITQDQDADKVTLTVIPEPSSMALFTGSIAFVILLYRRRMG